MRTQGINLCDSRHSWQRRKNLRSHGIQPDTHPPFDFHTSFCAMIYITANPLEIMEFSSRSSRSSTISGKYLTIDLMRSVDSRYHVSVWSEFSITGGHLSGRDRSDRIHHIRDQVLVLVNDYLLRFITAQDIQTPPAFLPSCADISGAWSSASLKAVARHDDPTVDLILRIQKMHVTGCDRPAYGTPLPDRTIFLLIS